MRADPAVEAAAFEAAAFQADPAVALRMAGLVEAVGAAVASDVREIVGVRSAETAGGSVVPAAIVGQLVRRHGLESDRELALLALPVAREMARAPISGYRVAAVGIEAGSGDVLLGANLEFPGAELGTTVHAEGFVALRARRRGRGLAVLALGEAHPCAFCRQTLAEAEDTDTLRLVDLLGHELRLADLYPWAFKPGALGIVGDAAGRMGWPALEIAEGGVPGDVSGVLVAAGRTAHAPYSGAPSAVALRLDDGRLVAAGCVESVAYNPSVSALQAALVEVVAARAEPSWIVEAWLARTSGGAVDPAPGFRSLLGAVAPAARAGVFDWRST